MIDFDNYTNEDETEHNSKWSYIPDHPHRILTIGSDKICLYAKGPYEAKY